MGNGLAKLRPCFTGADRTPRRRRLSAAVISDPYDDSLGHSFCYVRRDPLTPAAAAAAITKVHNYAEEPTTFSISGASLGANPSTPLSTSILLVNDLTWPSSLASTAVFESSDSFAAVPLQPLPRLANSGPLQDTRGFLSGPLERGFLSGPIETPAGEFSGQLRRSLSVRPSRKPISKFFRAIKSVIRPREPLVPDDSSAASSAEEPDPPPSLQPVQWAQGKAGEDRVHVVVSEEHGLVFVGIYDGFNGPDATDYLVSNLYPAAHQQLKGLLWDDDEEKSDNQRKTVTINDNSISKTGSISAVNHRGVLKALAVALQKTEEAYLDMADKMVSENHPELALMGSCVLVMLMKGDDVYLMNVGDSRAVLAHKVEQHDVRNLNSRPMIDPDKFREEILNDFDDYRGLTQLCALQLSLDHSTSVSEEVRRIRNEHPDDASAIVNDRVKGSLKVTRAFGAGYLKQRKWNDALLEMFRIDYVGTAPYITCTPFLYHHRLGPNDRFFILSSDGLYQYFTNEEAVTQVGLFLEASPEGDPAQHLVEEVLFRAARKAGMDFHELLEIPQGDRRRYHDDVSIIVISFEGRIWRSCM